MKISKKRVIFSLLALLLSLVLLVSSVIEYAWLSDIWGSSDTQQSFASGLPLTANLRMWTYDTENEVDFEGDADKWTCKYDDYLVEENERTDEKIIEKFGVIDNGVFTLTKKINITFGIISDFVNDTKNNDVYFRFDVTAISSSDAVVLDLGHEDDNVTCYGIESNDYVDVTSEVNEKITSDNNVVENTMKDFTYFKAYYYISEDYIQDEYETPEEFADVVTENAVVLGDDTVLNTSGLKEYHIYVKMTPNLDGLRSVVKYLFEYMPNYLLFDLTFSLSMEQPS